jgi:hypothetical protein
MPNSSESALRLTDAPLQSFPCQRGKRTRPTHKSARSLQPCEASPTAFDRSCIDDSRRLLLVESALLRVVAIRVAAHPSTLWSIFSSILLHFTHTCDAHVDLELNNGELPCIAAVDNHLNDEEPRPLVDPKVISAERWGGISSTSTSSFPTLR